MTFFKRASEAVKVPENETKALLDQTLSRKTADAVLVPVTPVL
jgi:hypothetical protein